MQQQLISVQKEQEVLTLESMIAGEEKERLRIAKELHDGVNGDLSAIRHKLSSLLKMNNDVINEAVSMIDNSCEQVRAISHDLVPPALSSFDLKTAASDYCAKMDDIHSPTISFQYLGDVLALSKKIEVNIFRIIQELVTNSIKHADAQEIHVQLSAANGNLQLTVEDDGVGFNTSQDAPAGMGLTNIKHRVTYLNGELDITSKNGSTYVSILMDKKDLNEN
jgi:signal transduction histidine kinase